jgi:hypothetical protein
MNWPQIIGHHVAAVVTLVFMGILLWASRRGKPLRDAYTNAMVFRHGILIRGFALLGTFGAPSAITLIGIFRPPPPQPGDFWAVCFLYALFPAISAPLLWESMRFAMKVSPEGLDCRSPWRGTRFLAWDDIKEISYSQAWSWFVVRAVDGWKFRVPLLIPGLGHWLEQCERYLPESALARAKTGYEVLGRQFPG